MPPTKRTRSTHEGSHHPSTVEEQLSIEQVAERLGVNYSTAWRWIKTQRIKPAYKLGKRIVRVPASAVNRFLESRKTI